ncbi:MAG: hypothetical protein WBP64_15700 [Nitrososphaeraceae archaeon]
MYQNHWRTLGCINDGDGKYFSEHIARAFAEGKIGLPSISIIDNIAIDAIDKNIIRNFFLNFRSWFVYMQIGLI